MPAGTVDPSGQTIGGGGGGGGHGSVAAMTEPSAQVCVAGATGRVAQADTNEVPATSNQICFIRLSFFVVLAPGDFVSLIGSIWSGELR